MPKQLTFDLGEKSEGPCGPCCTSSDDTETRKYYPSFSYHGKRKLEIPEEGIMTVRYRKTSSSVSEGQKPGDKRYSCCVEVREIVSIDADGFEAPSKRNNEAADALDKLMKEKETEY